MARISDPTRRAFLAGTGAAALMPLASALRAGTPAAENVLRIGATLPIAGAALPEGAVNLRSVGEAARMGLALAEEDAALNAGLLGWSPELAIGNAPGAGAVARAARRLVAREQVSVLIGGYTTEEAEILSAIAEESGALFLNVGATSDLARSGPCRANTFHVEASAAMYVDAILGWHVRAGFRRWHFVHDETAEGEARRARAAAGLEDRYWGAEVVGASVARRGETRDTAAVLDAIRESRSDVVFLLTDWQAQRDFLSHYEAAGLTAAVVGFPEPAAQTRDYYFTLSQVAPAAGAGYRAALWEPTLDAYGARELNTRFAARWGAPMDPAAWSAYQAVKIAMEAAIATGSARGEDLARHLAREESVFDVSKGIGVSFRPWDHQLRQPLYLVKVNPDASPSRELPALAARASLAGELPAIYMPGTEPVERLDQLGDIRRSGECRA
ncbi:ABC transporter substrate-binding protein [Amaricoccus solimangrovi]|uniref:Leucine-binding protein domain-containing protein n=1 Tax=Amaricoccus solimangrovi TaxID=2589815 RepID=A0A501WQ47_9RHOB|nr:ABC transporter substrate-binding protein [Amaricoccus solimangrovi]TPE50982.1 hypothetical protein FJM51_10090 [Amaricoccus solimangrovi]